MNMRVLKPGTKEYEAERARILSQWLDKGQSPMPVLIAALASEDVTLHPSLVAIDGVTWDELTKDRRAGENRDD